MSEANKCDVTGCGEFSEGSPVGVFQYAGQRRGMCQKHAEALIESYFPEMKEKPEEEKKEEAKPKDAGTKDEVSPAVEAQPATDTPDK